MTIGRGAMSLLGVTGSTAIGENVYTGPSRVFTCQVTLQGTTKAVVRMQGSVNGAQWTAIGAANATMANGGLVTSTSVHAYPLARVILVSRTTAGSTVAEKVSAWVSGY